MLQQEPSTRTGERKPWRPLLKLSPHSLRAPQEPPHLAWGFQERGVAVERAASGQEAAAPERAVCAQRCGVRALLAGDLPRRQRAGREAEGMCEDFPDVFTLFILSWILFSPSLLGTSSSSPLSSFYHSSSPLPSSLDPPLHVAPTSGPLPYLLLLLPLSPLASKSLPIFSLPPPLTTCACPCLSPVSPSLRLSLFHPPPWSPLNPFSSLFSYLVSGMGLHSVSCGGDGVHRRRGAGDVPWGWVVLICCLIALSHGSFLGLLFLMFACALVLTPYF